MNKIHLSFSEPELDEIWRHLLPHGQTSEEAAFVFAKIEQIGDQTNFKFIGWKKLCRKDFETQTGDYLELKENVRAEIIKRAHDLDASIIEFHSHMDAEAPAFSGADRAGLEDFVPYVWWRLKGKPYAAVVVNRSGFDGLAWISDPGSPVQITSIETGSESHIASCKTLPGWIASWERYDRNVRLFEREGQTRIRAVNAVVVGAGGLGTPVLQQLSHLGVGNITTIDFGDLKASSLNRYIGARHDDPIIGTRKVDIAGRMIRSIDPTIIVKKVYDDLRSEQAFSEIKKADFVFGCLDNNGARYVLNALCIAYDVPLIDLASDVDPVPTLTFGGHVCYVSSGSGCLVCQGIIDPLQCQSELMSSEGRINFEATYGVPMAHSADVGPSVVSINGVVASTAVTEFFLWATGIRDPKRTINYHGMLGKLVENRDPLKNYCYICEFTRGAGENAEVEKFILQKGTKQNSSVA